MVSLLAFHFQMNFSKNVITKYERLIRFMTGGEQKGLFSLFLFFFSFAYIQLYDAFKPILF